MALVSDLSNQLQDIQEKYSQREGHWTLAMEELARVRSEKDDRIRQLIEELSKAESANRGLISLVNGTRQENVDLRRNLSREHGLLQELQVRFSSCQRNKNLVIQHVSAVEGHLNVSLSESKELRHRISRDGRLLQETQLNLSFCEKDKAAFLGELEALEKHVINVDHSRTCCEQVPMCHLCAMKKGTQSMV